jgi:aspartate racemase
MQMKTIGLIGGMSWESSAHYYEVINAYVARELGGLHSAKIILYSVDFHDIEQLQADGKWDEITTILSDAAYKLEGAGVDFIVMCSNTIHKLAGDIQRTISVPLLDIVTVTGELASESKYKTVALVGTTYLLEDGFYAKCLTDSFGLGVIQPNISEIEQINDALFSEIADGSVTPSTKAAFVALIENLASQGADAVILGCTEYGLVVEASDVTIPLIDTAVIHAERAAKQSLPS